MTDCKAREDFIERSIAWGMSIIDSGNYTYKWYGKTDHKCPICHPDTPDAGFNCIGFVCACLGHGGGDRTMLKNCEWNNGRALGGDTSLTLVTAGSWRRQNGRNWNMLKIGRKNGNSIPTSMMERGDVVLGYTSRGKYMHTMLYIGDGRFIDARPEDDPSREIRIRTYEEETRDYHLTRLFRYVYDEDNIVK